MVSQSPVAEGCPVPPLTVKTSYLRLITLVVSTISSGILLGVISISANASSLISSTDYLDYQLPKHVQKKCAERKSCPKIEVKYLKTNHDWINKITNARINNLVVNSKPTESVPTTTINRASDIKAAIDDFAQSQFVDIPDSSSSAYHLMVTPDYLGHVDKFELFELNSYVFTGGAHGMPYSEYLIFDSGTKKQVQLANMLYPNKKALFEALAYTAYKAWVRTVTDDSSAYENNWPFTLSDNITLTDQGIDIRYQHYSIGPYAYGMPVLSIPYSKLDGVIKPRFIPK